MDPLEEKQKKEQREEPKITEEEMPDLEVIDDKPMDKKIIAIGVVILIAAGIITGYFLSRSSNPAVLSMTGSTKIIKTEKIVGSLDEKAFPDSAEGTLEKGGIDGEGTHKLTREGGPSQTVYMTSSVINLDEFVGKKVKVWGETFAAQKAGWLMDVGRLEIYD